MYLFPEIAFPISGRDAQSKNLSLLFVIARARSQRPAACFGAKKCRPEESAFRFFSFNVRYFASTRKSLPVISFGCGIPKTPSIVGAMSRSAPPGLSRTEPSSCRRINGTGFVVW